MTKKSPHPTPFPRKAGARGCLSTIADGDLDLGHASIDEQFRAGDVTGIV